MLDKLFDILSQNFDNVSLRNNKIWVLLEGDIYEVFLKNGKVVIRRNWWNLFLLVIVAVVEFLIIEWIATKWLWKFFSEGWHLVIFAVIYLITVYLIARNNKRQRCNLLKIRRVIEQSGIKF